MRVRNPEHELSTVEVICSDLLRSKSTAGGALDFRKRIHFVFVDQLAQHRIAQSRRRNEADCPVL
jgi:hypothetical protein